MVSKDELKEIGFKNRTCYYSDDVIKARDINSINILLEEKIYRNVLIDDVSYKGFMGSITLRIRLARIDGFIKIYDEIRYLVISGNNWFDEIVLNTLQVEKSCIKDNINHNFARISTNSYNRLLTEKILTHHNVIILSQSVVNMNENNYYYDIFLEKRSYKDKSNTKYF